MVPNKKAGLHTKTRTKQINNKDYNRHLKVHTHELVSRGQTLVSRRGVFAFSISAPHKRGSGRVHSAMVAEKGHPQPRLKPRGKV